MDKVELKAGYELKIADENKSPIVLTVPRNGIVRCVDAHTYEIEEFSTSEILAVYCPSRGRIWGRPTPQEDV